MEISNLKCILILFAVLQIVFCSIDEGNTRRVGDFLAPPGSGRYHGSIQDLYGGHLCGSAIISDRHVLTAGHCAFGKRENFMRIVVGTTNLNVGGLYYFVENYRIHRNFIAPTLQNDLAVIKIRGIFNLNAVQIINLSPRELQERDIVRLVGFGAAWQGGASRRVMHYLDLPVINQQVCANAYRNKPVGPVMATNFCTFTKYGQGACAGDSGSPITLNNQLVGIVSRGIPPCAQGFPDVHMRVNRYINWIIEQTRY